MLQGNGDTLKPAAELSLSTLAEEIRVGTSGYSYPWNEGKPSPFEWYLKLGFNTVEINASFYRFPMPAWVNVWIRAPADFTFSIKVHRLITHRRRLGEESVETLERFQEPLEPLADRIAFWLFQMPPSFAYSENNLERVTSFLREADLESSAAVEFRHSSWWDHIDEVEGTKAAFCSVDAPGLPRDIVAVNDVVYLRIHGRDSWYSYVYSEDELEEVAHHLEQVRASRKYVYVNNDEGMLPNGGYLKKRLGVMGGQERLS